MILIIRQMNNLNQDIPALCRMLDSFNADYFLFELWQYPMAYAIQLCASDVSQSYILEKATGRRVYFAQIQSAYWVYSPAYFMQENIPAGDVLTEQALFQFGSFQKEETLYSEHLSALGSLFRLLDCFWVDPIEVFENHLYKLSQQHLFQQLGVTFPDTIITSDPQAVRAFYDRHRGQVIYKPCWMGAFASRMSESDLTAERLDTLTVSPVTFQAFVPGCDLFALVIGDAIFAARIETEEMLLDFRTGQNNRYLPITLPEDISRQCFAMTRQIGSRFAVIDLRYTPEGEFVFLEVNPSPACMHFQQGTGFPITEHLARLLMSPPHVSLKPDSLSRQKPLYFGVSKD